MARNFRHPGGDYGLDRSIESNHTRKASAKMTEAGLAKERAHAAWASAFSTSPNNLPFDSIRIHFRRLEVTTVRQPGRYECHGGADRLNFLLTSSRFVLQDATMEHPKININKTFKAEGCEAPGLTEFSPPGPKPNTPQPSPPSPPPPPGS